MTTALLHDKFHQSYLPEPNSGCWLWDRGCIGSGYGEIWDGSKSLLAHRISWEIHRGPIPKGMCVLHRCDVPACVNPDHLWLGTKADNAKDMVAKGRHVIPRCPAHRAPRGEKNGLAKLTEAAVRIIRTSLATNTELARVYGVSPPAISVCRARKTWAHVRL